MTVERSNDGAVLKRCPFCNGEEITMGAFSISADCYIMCKTCGASIEKEVAWNGMTRKEHDEECRKVLAEAWNTRKPLERVIERLEEEAKECEKYWGEFDDEDAFGGMNAYFNSIAIIKEELM